MSGVGIVVVTTFWISTFVALFTSLRMHALNISIDILHMSALASRKAAVRTVSFSIMVF